MHLPSRGLRLSATTMRKAGVFFAPMRFMRILTDIIEISILEIGLYPDSKRGARLDRPHPIGKPCFTVFWPRSPRICAEAMGPQIYSRFRSGPQICADSGVPP